MITPIGELSIGDAMPGAVAVGVAGAAGIGLALPDLQSRIAALLAFAPVEVDFAAQLTLAQQTVASIQATIAAGITPPSIAEQLAQVAALIADLLASLSSIAAQLTIITDFQALLVNEGLHAYAFSGSVSSFGDELDAEIGAGLPGGAGASEAVDGLVLVTNVGATWSALAQIMQVSP
jgi:hypothetical protein